MIFLDTDIFLYAAGVESERREHCQGVLGRIVEEEAGLVARTDAEVLREMLARYRAMGKPEVGGQLFDLVASLGIPVLPVSEEDLRRARGLLASHPDLPLRTALHAGVMQAGGVGRVLSYDTAFDLLEGVERLEPFAP